jgi:hypothetical protein
VTLLAWLQTRASLGGPLDARVYLDKPHAPSKNDVYAVISRSVEVNAHEMFQSINVTKGSLIVMLYQEFDETSTPPDKSLLETAWLDVQTAWQYVTEWDALPLVNRLVVDSLVPMPALPPQHNTAMKRYEAIVRFTGLLKAVL